MLNCYAIASQLTDEYGVPRITETVVFESNTWLVAGALRESFHDHTVQSSVTVVVMRAVVVRTCQLRVNGAERQKEMRERQKVEESKGKGS